jgi:hypothetical protein
VVYCAISRNRAANFSAKAAITIYVNRRAQKSSAIPRHREIIDFLARKICKDLDIPEP